MIDVNQMREPDITLHQLTRADSVYILYYNETNNIRRLHNRADGLNVSEPKCFVISGIAHHGEPRALDIEDLRKRCRIQKTIKDIKLEHIAKAGNLMQMDQLLAGVVILSVFGLTVGKLINLLEVRLLRWRVSTKHCFNRRSATWKRLEGVLHRAAQFHHQPADGRLIGGYACA